MGGRCPVLWSRVLGCLTIVVQKTEIKVVSAAATRGQFSRLACGGAVVCLPHSSTSVMGNSRWLLELNASQALLSMYMNHV